MRGKFAGFLRAEGGVRLSAWGIFVAWAGFWLFFNIGSAFYELATEGVGAFLGHFLFAVVIAALIFAVIRSRPLGGILLAAISVFFFLFFHAYNDLIVALILFLRLLVSGILFMAGGAIVKSRKRGIVRQH